MRSRFVDYNLLSYLGFLVGLFSDGLEDHRDGGHFLCVTVQFRVVGLWGRNHTGAGRVDPNLYLPQLFSILWGIGCQQTHSPFFFITQLT